MAGKIIIAYKNWVDDSGTTLVSSTEASGYEKANVQAVQLSEFLRSTALSPAYIEARFGAPRAIRLLAALGCTATGTRNILQQSEDTSAGVWTETKWSATDTTATHGGTAPSPLGFKIFDSPIDRTSGEHYAEQDAFTLPAVSVANPNFRIHVFARDNGNANRLRLEVNDGASGYARADFNISTGSVTASDQDGTTFASASGSIEDKSTGTTWFKCTLTCSVSSTAAQLTVRIQALSSGGATTYTPSSDFQWCNLYAGITDVAQDGEVTTTESESVANWRYDTASSVGGSATSSFLLPFPLCGGLLGRSTIDGYYLLGTETTAQSARLDLYDPTNDATWVDIPRFFVGPVLQPTIQTVTLLDQDFQNGRRINTYGLNYILKSEAQGDVAEMLRTIDVRPGQQWESMDGQVSRPRAGAILVIADADATINQDQELIYGFINDVSPAYRQSGRAYSVTHGEPVFSFNFTVEEIIA